MIPVNSVLQVGFFPEIMQDEVLRRLTPVMMLDPKGPIPQGDVQAILTRPSYPITPALLDQLPQVKMIACCGVGYDNLPLDYLKQRGIMASNTPGVLNDAVCELTIGMLFALLRQIPKAHEFVSKKQWGKGAFPFMTSLAGKAVGIVGMGRIGQELAARLVPFKVRIAYHGPHDKHLSYAYVSSLVELAKASDVLILCCPGGKETEGMIHQEVLEALGPSSYLINVARGSVVNESDLLTALQSGKIAGAALDVFENEPNPDPRFLELPNVVLTPHIGSATQETRQAMTNLAIDNLDAFFSQRPLPTPIAM